jgi:hypothetical protein
MREHSVHAVTETHLFLRTEMNTIANTHQNTLPPNRHALAILRRKDVEQITGLSRSSIYAGIKKHVSCADSALCQVGWMGR